MQSNEEISKIIGAELEGAIMVGQAQDGGQRAVALGYYSGALPENDDKNQDPNREAVSLDVADMVEAVYAQIAPALEDAGGIEFEALSADDEAQAQKESAIVRAMLMDGQHGDGGFVALSEAIKDALLMRTGTLALWIDRKETRTPEKWENVPPLALGEIAKPTAEGQRVESFTTIEEEPEEEGAEMTYTVTLTRVDVEKRLAVAAVAPENVVSSSMHERDPNRRRFVADRVVTTRSALINEGFSVGEVQALKRHDPTTYELYLDRAALGGMQGEPAQVDTVQAATETVEVWRCYVMLGETMTSPRAERYRVWYSRDNKQVIGKPERVGRVCYAVGNVILFPHRLDGVSLFDKIGEVQELKTKALRAWVENLHKVNRPRIGVDESLVNMADVLDATQDAIRMRGPNAMVPIPTIDAGPSVAMFLQYQDQCRSERGGASLDMQTSSAQIATNQTASGIERQYSVKEQLAATMARTFAETALRSMYQIAHYLLRTSWGSEVEAKIGGEWTAEDPATWRPRSGVVVRVGQSVTERARKGQSLQQVIGMQAQMLQAGKGGILTDDSKLYNAAFDMISASQLRSPERYLIDPASPEAQAVAKENARKAQASQLAQGEAANAAMALEKYKIDIQALSDMLGHIVKAAIEEAKLTLSTAPLDEVQELGSAAMTQSARSIAEEEREEPGEGVGT